MISPINDPFDTAPTFDDPIGMLRACHRRIERAIDLMGALADRERSETLDRSARDTLRQVLHYFATGVPRHARDEEESLFPRLREVLETQEPAALLALHALEQDHVIVDAAHRELEALAEPLLRSGRFESPEERERFTRLVARMRELYQEHIRLEDEEILPLAAARVDAKGRELIGAEMAARRGIDWEEQREVLARMAARPWSRRAKKAQETDPILEG